MDADDRLQRLERGSIPRCSTTIRNAMFYFELDIRSCINMRISKCTEKVIATADGFAY
jgi:hypothetical protein